MVNRDRLSNTFKSLAEIDSISMDEFEICSYLKNILDSLGAKTVIDNAGEKIGGNTGNLIAKFDGNVEAEPLLLNAHMDTVEPGRNIKVVFKDGIFKSAGDTILGADDKSAIAILLETIHVLKENNLDHGPLEFLFTVCEEVGLKGARHLDARNISAKLGYTLDTTDTNCIITRAPAANHLEFKIFGKDAHAGVAPETGINAISLASKAIALIEWGRIDHETSCNVGIIEGGTATNIVPNLTKVQCEVRSHSHEKLEDMTRKIVYSFKKVIKENAISSNNNGLPRLESHVENEFPLTNINKDHPVIEMALKAAKNLGFEMKLKSTGGGADANIFFSKGIITGVIGTGMRDMHTSRESVSLDDLSHTTKLLLEIIKIHSQGQISG